MGSDFKILYVTLAMILMMLCLDISSIAIVTVKGVDYRCIIHDISKSEAIHMLKNPVVDDRGCI